MCGGLAALVRIAWGWYNIVSTRWVCCSVLGDSGFGVQFARVFVLGLFVAFIGAGCWWLAYFAVVGVWPVVWVDLAVSGLFDVVV